MSNNIWGYQGLQTPLENLTNGNYTVADYTAMRTEFNARILALENAGGFQPTNVTMVGYLNMVAGTGGNGSITAPGPVSFGNTLTVGNTTILNAPVTIGSTLTVNSTTTLNAPVTVVGGLSVSSGVTCAGANISGDLVVGGTTTLAGVSITNMSASSFSTDSADVDNNLTVGGTINSDGDISTSGNFIGDGSLLTNIPSSTFTGGTLTSTLTTRDVDVQNGYSITGNGSRLSTFAVVGYAQNSGDIIIPAANYSKYFHLFLAYSNPCSVKLTNFGFTIGNFPDYSRTVTITKKSFASPPTYIVTLYLPVQAGIVWKWVTPTLDGSTGTYQMGVDVASVTFNFYFDNAYEGYLILVSQVKV